MRTEIELPRLSISGRVAGDGQSLEIDWGKDN
jgi:hypothetical protein